MGKKSTGWLLPCGMLQGSAGISLLFNICVKMVGKLIHGFERRYHQYDGSTLSQAGDESPLAAPLKKNEQNCAVAETGGFGLSNS